MLHGALASSTETRACLLLDTGLCDGSIASWYTLHRFDADAYLMQHICLSSESPNKTPLHDLGDNATTGSAIARQAGILPAGCRVFRPADQDDLLAHLQQLGAPPDALRR